ncbi:MAG: hypothetical protein WBZ36_28065, partial [Candidatus Nitrosopolaris sp.]
DLPTKLTNSTISASDTPIFCKFISFHIYWLSHEEHKSIFTMDTLKFINESSIKRHTVVYAKRNSVIRKN